MKEVRLILIAAPSGAGKNSFMERAFADFPKLQDVITHTTREMRFGDVKKILIWEVGLQFFNGFG